MCSLFSLSLFLLGIGFLVERLNKDTGWNGCSLDTLTAKLRLYYVKKTKKYPHCCLYLLILFIYFSAIITDTVEKAGTRYSIFFSEMKAGPWPFCGNETLRCFVPQPHNDTKIKGLSLRNSTMANKCRWICNKWILYNIPLFYKDKRDRTVSLLDLGYNSVKSMEKIMEEDAAWLAVDIMPVAPLPVLFQVTSILHYLKRHNAVPSNTYRYMSHLTSAALWITNLHWPENKFYLKTYTTNTV